MNIGSAVEERRFSAAYCSVTRARPLGPGVHRALQSVSQLKVLLESGIASRKLAAKRRKNAAHGASRGWKVANDRAPEERKKSCDTGSSAPPPEPSEMSLGGHGF